jgi:hexosaminidase
MLFDVLDEVIEVFNPKVVHIGHDELRTYGVCEKCRQKNPARIFADDVIKIYNYLKDRGIRTMMWGDKLLNAHKDNTWSAEGGAMLGVTFKKSDEKINFLGKEIKRTLRHGRITFWDDPKKLPEGIEYSIMKPLHPCISMIPTDIIQVNWFYDFYSQSDEDYDTYGFPMVYGNFEGSAFRRWFDRANASAKGVVVSSWGASDYKQMQRGRRIFEAIYASRMVWNRNYDESKRIEEFDNTTSEIFNYRFGEALKGSYIDILHTVDLTVPHGYYGCGDFPSDDMFRLGHYHIYYKDGSDEKVEILWGENVGPMEIENDLASKLGNNAVQSYETAYYLETAFTNDWKVIDKKRYYRFVIPTKKAVDRVELELFDEYTEKFTLHSLDINN